MSPTVSIAQIVADRADGRCEYCQMHQSLQGATFHIEHVVPRCRGGVSSVQNLAFCCPSCNLQKSDREQAIDPATGAMVPLFHPRREVWSEHFQWNGFSLEAKTPVGRATIKLLKLNSARRLLIREVESTFGLFPPNV